MKKAILFLFLGILLSAKLDGQSREALSSKPKSPCKGRFHHLNSKSNFTCIEEVAPMEASLEVKTLLESLLRALNLSYGIKVFQSDSIEDISGIFDENARFIVYNKSFFNRYFKPNSENWELKFAFAHEIAHHLNGDNFVDPAINHEEEADQFAGWLLGILGATPDEALLWINSYKKEWSDGIHAPKATRISRIMTGHKSARELMTYYNGSQNKELGEIAKGTKIVVNNKDYSGPWTLNIAQVGHFTYKEIKTSFDINEDFKIIAKIKSIRLNGSTRFGIAWNFESGDDYYLFTLHNEDRIKNNTVYYSIGRGNCQKCSEGFVRYNTGEVKNTSGNEFNLMTIEKINNTLKFYINSLLVWETKDYKINTNKLAIWLADRSQVECQYLSVDQK